MKFDINENPEELPRNRNEQSLAKEFGKPVVLKEWDVALWRDGLQDPGSSKLSYHLQLVHCPIQIIFFLIQLSVSISLKSFLIFLFGLLRTFVCIHFSIFCLFHGYSHSLSFHKSLWHLWIDHPSLIIYNQILLLCQIYSIYVPFTTFIASLWTNKIRYRVGSIKKKKYQFCIWKHLFPFISLKHGYILKLP